MCVNSVPINQIFLLLSVRVKLSVLLCISLFLMQHVTFVQESPPTVCLLYIIKSGCKKVELSTVAHNTG